MRFRGDPRCTVTPTTTVIISYLTLVQQHVTFIYSVMVVGFHCHTIKTMSVCHEVWVRNWIHATFRYMKKIYIVQEYNLLPIITGLYLWVDWPNGCRWILGFRLFTHNAKLTYYYLPSILMYYMWKLWKCCTSQGYNPRGILCDEYAKWQHNVWCVNQSIYGHITMLPPPRLDFTPHYMSYSPRNALNITHYTLQLGW